MRERERERGEKGKEREYDIGSISAGVTKILKKIYFSSYSVFRSCTNMLMSND